MDTAFGITSASQEMAIEPLIGTDESSVDDKGRLRLPNKKADRLGRNFVLWHDPVGCLVAYPLRIWRQKAQEILSKPASSFDREVLLRDMGAGAEDENNCDAQGRIVIPKRFRTALGLEGEVVLVGAIDRMEIWPKADFEKFTAERLKHTKSLRQMAEAGGLPATG